MVPLSHDELEAMLDRAAEEGAKKALARIGLHDEGAAGDIRDLRSLLEAFQAAKRTVWQAVWKTLTTALLAALLAGLAIKIKVCGGAP